jgi:D-sedoheptulose 7-phosphate isomerase
MPSSKRVLSPSKGILVPADAKAVVRRHLEASAAVKRAAADSCAEPLVALAGELVACFRQRGRLLLCGNGGSAADCQHIAAEFVSVLNQRFVRPALAAIALTTDTSFLTASANDFGFEHIFSRQVEALGQRGDVVIGISTSGNSPNVVAALRRGKELGLRTGALTGGSGGIISSIADISVCVPSESTQHIQETHLALGHVLCELVEHVLFGT